MWNYGALSNIAHPGGHSAHISGFLEDETNIKRFLVVNETHKLKVLIAKLVVTLKICFLLCKREKIYLRASPILMFVIIALKKSRLLKPQCIAWEVNGVFELESNLGGHGRLKKAIYKAMEREVFWTVDSLVYVSHGIKEYYEKKFPFVTNKGIVAENGYPARLTKVARKKDYSRHSVGYIGLYTSWQDFDSCCSVIEASERYRDREFLMVGTGPEEQSWRKSAHTRELKIQWSPSIPYQKIEEAYAKITIGLVPDIRCSLGDNKSSPIKLIEYAASGVFPIFVKDQKAWHPLTLKEITLDEVMGYSISEIESVNQKLTAGRSWPEVIQRVFEFCDQCAAN